jgi:hypothetical protein
MRCPGKSQSVTPQSLGISIHAAEDKAGFEKTGHKQKITACDLVAMKNSG